MKYLHSLYWRVWWWMHDRREARAVNTVLAALNGLDALYLHPTPQSGPVAVVTWVPNEYEAPDSHGHMEGDRSSISVETNMKEY